MDPETLALIRAWLAGEIPDPFGVSEQDANIWSQNFLPPEDSDEYGTMDWQNARLTMGKKANDVMSDPAYIAQLGTGPGGPGPEAFEPIVTYEPVKAPGYQSAMFMLNSGDPISSYIAGEMMGDPASGRLGKTAIQVVNELKQAAKNDPELAAALPTYVNNMNMREEPDWKSVQTIADNLQKDIIADPQFNDYDPKTGLPANKVETLPEIGQYFKDTNTPSPYETYSPDMLTTEGRLRADDNASKLAAANQNRVKASEKDRNMNAAMLRELYQGRTMDEPVGGVSPNMEAYGSGGGVDVLGTADRATESAGGWLDKTIGNPLESFFGGQTDGGVADLKAWLQGESRPTTGSIGSLGGPAAGNWDGGNMGERARNSEQLQNRTSLNRKKQGAQAAQATARVNQERQVARNNAKGALGENLAAVYATYTKRAEKERREREAMMRELTAAGYTPYNNTQRARQAGVFGI